ncbi:DUF2063 domain-containing protein [Permianibacter sp. IMCC34836]|uniref:HvfC/BufC N-terminal domain-containing protein n=1 Tax=Permianibacter fluminis TaxID=2738515 RepID=UPI0015541FD7|nr:DNA-binding domain-containing protein [Permianibacter fluminis]NQD37983.1 DUF2063 domain-containing protein [Permianibacter fluminis]
MRLAELQAAFQAHMLSGSDAILPHIQSTPTLDNTARMAIYRNAYYARLRQVLQVDFPAVTTWLADDAAPVFEAYIAQHPSQSFTLRFFGQSFAEFLTQQEVCQRQPWLPDLARFEWAFCDAFDAPDYPLVGLADMAQVPPEQWPTLRLAWHPSVQCLASRFNIAALWRKPKLETGEAISETIPETIPETIFEATPEAIPDAATQPLPTEICCLIWRGHDLSSHFRSLAADEALALQLMKRGGNFAELCEAILPFHDAETVAFRAAALLKTWLQDGLLTELQVGN